jgi:Flp pilus assembly protein TadG
MMALGFSKLVPGGSRGNGGAAMQCLGSDAKGFRTMLLDRRGAAMVEFALVATVLIGLLMPLVDIGMGFYYKTQVMTAAQAGAQYAFVHGWNGTDNSVATAVTSATSLSGITALPAPTKKTGCWTLSGTTYGLNTSNPASPCPSPNSLAPGQYVTAGATVTYTPVLNYAGFGNPVTLVATSTVRIQ